MDQNTGGSTQTTILDELGLGDLPQEQKDQLLNQMIDSLNTRILNRVSNVLTDEDVDNLEKLSEQDPTGDLANQFLAAKVPNFNAIALEETDRFKREMKDSLEAMTASLPQ